MDETKLRIDRDDLLMALSDHSIDHFLDLRTGAVIEILDDIPELESVINDIDENPERYLAIEPIPSRDGFRWMEEFADQQSPEVRKALHASLDRRRPFRSFRDELHAYPEVLAAWYAYEEDRQLEYARGWLRGEGLEAAELFSVRLRSEADGAPS